MSFRKLRIESLETRNLLAAEYVLQHATEFPSNANESFYLSGGTDDSLVFEHKICEAGRCTYPIAKTTLQGEMLENFPDDGDGFYELSESYIAFTTYRKTEVYDIDTLDHILTVDSNLPIRQSFHSPSLSDSFLAIGTRNDEFPIEILIYSLRETDRGNLITSITLGDVQALSVNPLFVGEYLVVPINLEGNHYRVDVYNPLSGELAATMLDPVPIDNAFGLSHQYLTTWHDSLVILAPGNVREIHIFDPSSGIRTGLIPFDFNAEEISGNSDNLVLLSSTLQSYSLHIYSSPNEDPVTIEAFADLENSSSRVYLAGDSHLLFQTHANNKVWVFREKEMAPELPTFGIDRWWGSVGDHPFPVEWTVDVPESGTYRFDLDIDDLSSSWDLVDGSIVIVDNGPGIAIDNITGRASLGQLDSGVHTFKIANFDIPSTAIVEEITFQLVETTGINHEAARLDALFIADWPEDVTDDLFADGVMLVPDVGLIPDVQTLIEAFAPTIHLSEKEDYHPIDVNALLSDLKERNGDEMYANGQRGDRNDWLDLSPYADPHADDDIPSVIYASVLPCQPQHANHENEDSRCDEGNEIAINYFFVYARSNWADFDGANTHEGDVEGIIVFLEREDDQSPWHPTEVAYSQHTVIDGQGGGQILPWNQTPKTDARVDVFVGLGGHASYSHAGSTLVETNPITGHEELEIHDGKGSEFGPKLIIDTSDLVARLYSGYIGNRDLHPNPLVIGDVAPKGPLFQTVTALGGNLYGSRNTNPWHWSRGFDDVSSTDPDGVLDHIEDGAPNNGDGNLDKTFDSEQDNVASLPDAIDGDYVTLVTSDGGFSQVAALPPALGQPEDVTLPVGEFDFKLTGLRPGQEVTVTYLLPEGTNVNTFYKYGPTADDPSDHWYEFLWDEVTRTGAIVTGNVITVRYKDGGRGDSDGKSNGIIVDPAAPAYRTTVSDVFASVLDGSLIIVGADQDDQISIYQINSHSFFVQGIGGTTVNGSAERQIFQFALAVEVDLGQGDDNFTIETPFDIRRLGTSLILNTGSGDDTVTFTSYIGLGLTFVNTGTGNDTVNILSSAFYGPSLFDLGADDDKLVIDQIYILDQAIINGGPGTDEVDAVMFDLTDLNLTDFEIGGIEPLPALLFKPLVLVNQWHKKHRAFVA